ARCAPPGRRASQPQPSAAAKITAQRIAGPPDFDDGPAERTRTESHRMASHVEPIVGQPPDTGQPNPGATPRARAEARRASSPGEGRRPPPARHPPPAAPPRLGLLHVPQLAA